MLISKGDGSFKCNFSMYQIEHVDKLSMGTVKMVLAGGPGGWRLGVN